MNIVEKYGGTSVADLDKIRAIAQHVKEMKAVSYTHLDVYKRQTVFVSSMATCESSVVNISSFAMDISIVSCKASGNMIISNS